MNPTGVCAVGTYQTEGTAEAKVLTRVFMAYSKNCKGVVAARAM